MAAIRKRVDSQGHTHFHVQIRIKGRPPQTGSFERLTDARQWAQRVESDIRRSVAFPESDAKKHTVAEAIGRYIATVLGKKQRNTQGPQKTQLAWWRDQIGHMRLSDVTTSLIAEARDNLPASFTSATVRRYLSAISHVFSVTVKEFGWIPSNPALNVKRPKESPGRTRFLSDDERVRLL